MGGLHGSRLPTLLDSELKPFCIFSRLNHSFPALSSTFVFVAARLKALKKPCLWCFPLHPPASLSLPPLSQLPHEDQESRQEKLQSWETNKERLERELAAPWAGSGGGRGRDRGAGSGALRQAWSCTPQPHQHFC